MLYILMVGLAGLSIYWIVIGLSLLFTVGTSLVAIPIAGVVKLGQRISGKMGEFEVDRAALKKEGDEAIADAERVLNRRYELKYDSDDAPQDVDENGIPYL